MERFVDLGNVITNVINVMIQVDIIRDVGRCFRRLHIALENGLVGRHGRVSRFLVVRSRLRYTKMPNSLATMLFF